MNLALSPPPVATKPRCAAALEALSGDQINRHEKRASSPSYQLLPERELERMEGDPVSRSISAALLNRPASALLSEVAVVESVW
jgi:hypothetical protein